MADFKLNYTPKVYKRFHVPIIHLTYKKSPRVALVALLLDSSNSFAIIETRNRVTV